MLRLSRPNASAENRAASANVARMRLQRALSLDRNHVAASSLHPPVAPATLAADDLLGMLLGEGLPSAGHP